MLDFASLDFITLTIVFVIGFCVGAIVGYIDREREYNAK